MKNFSKYLTLNFLSLLGYIFFVFTLIVLFVLFPITRHMDIISNEDMAYNTAGLVIIFFEVILVYTIVELITFCSAFLEFIVYFTKKTEPKLIKIPDKYKKLHFIIFITGLTLLIIPIGIACYWLIN